MIVEDLTKSIYTLFGNASDHPGTLRAWTSDGKIFVQDIDFKTHKIETLSDLSKLSFDADVSEPIEEAVGKRGDGLTGPTTSQAMEAEQTRSKETAGGDQTKRT